MAWIHQHNHVTKAERDRRIGLLVARRLRLEGFAVSSVPHRDTFGARVVPHQLACGHVLILCRHVAHTITSSEREFIAARPGAYVQLGAADITALVKHLNGALW